MDEQGVEETSRKMSGTGLSHPARNNSRKSAALSRRWSVPRPFSMCEEEVGKIRSTGRSKKWSRTLIVNWCRHTSAAREPAMPQACGVHCKSAVGPVAVKSPPCTVSFSSLFTCSKLHGLASPALNPHSSRNVVYSLAQFCAASLSSCFRCHRSPATRSVKHGNLNIRVGPTTSPFQIGCA